MQYGCLFQDVAPEICRIKMDNAGFGLTRNPVMLLKETYKPVIDQYLSDGYDVQINMNWSPTGVPGSGFPEHLKLLKARAMDFAEHYQPYLNSIPYVAVCNEWDNVNYYDNSIFYYIEALREIVPLLQSYGFTVADAAITGTSLQRWMWSQLSGKKAEEWAANYWVAQNREDYPLLCLKIEYYISQIKSIPIDLLNMHWYNKEQCSFGFKDASERYAERCQKGDITCNEFGIRTFDETLWKDTVREISHGTGLDVAIAYSGTNETEKAVELTDEMLLELAD